MSSLVSCKGKVVWKYSSGSDDTFLGLTSIPSETKVGKVVNVSFDSERTDSYGEFVWKEVKDPVTEEVEGEVLIIEPQEVSALKEYVDSNTPSLSFLQKLNKKIPETTSLVEMLAATIPVLSTEETNEIIFTW
jgi:hypothetical protein